MIRITRIRESHDLRRAFRIRKQVFVREQGVPNELELDRDDARAIHLLAFKGKKAAGTARVVLDRGRAKIGRMAVLKGCRGRGIGARLLKRAVAEARRAGATSLFLHAQVSVIAFYEAAGFRCRGPIFQEAGIPHRKMIWRPPEQARWRGPA